MRRLSPRFVPLAALLSLGLTAVHASTLGPDPAWTAIYNSLGRGADAGKAVATDSAGNAYVTGYMFRRGAELDFVTLKYGPDGKSLWRASFDGPRHRTDVPSAIAVDGSGNVYVAGRSARGSGTEYDYVLLKYSAAGRLLWAKKQPGSPFVQSDGEYTPVHLAVDPAGNAYVSGYAPGGFRTTKYSPFGAELWSDAYGPTEEEPFLLAGFNQATLAPDGGLFLAGAVNHNPDHTDLLVVRYSPAGERMLVVNRPSPDGVVAVAAGLVPESGGGFSVTGVQRTIPNGTADVLVARFAADGTELWSRSYSQDLQSEDVPVAIALDANGNLIIAGSTQEAGQPATANVITLQYDAEGTLQWQHNYNGPLGREDRARALGRDADGTIYVAATLDGGEGETQNYGLLKLSADGELVTAASWDGPASRFDDVAGMAVDPEGAVTLTGISALSGTPASGYDYGIATLRYDAGTTGPALIDLKLLAPQVRSRKPVKGLIRLSEKATARGVVELHSSNPEALPVPDAGVAIERGRSTAQFTLRAGRVTEATEVTLTATLSGVTKETVVTVRP